MSDLLLELFSEEIPSGMQKPATDLMRRVLSSALSISDEQVKTHSTPRRITIEISGLSEKFADVSTEKRGPKVSAPEKAVQGFVKSVGLSIDDLEKRGDYYFAVQHTQGRATKDVAKEAIEKMLAEFHWKKSMRWGNTDIRWVRPLHNILCIFNDEIIPVKFGHLTANNKTFGHRFLSPDAVEVGSIAEYHKLLKEKFVVISHDERKEIILKQAKKITEATGLQMENNPALLDEVAGLVGYPQVLLGKFDDSFLKLPHEVIRSEMNFHQKYFCCFDGENILAPYFIIVSNLKTADNGKAITSGNERVLKARLKDAEFFWNEDMKKGLEAGLPKLEKMIFHNGIGSMADKVERITSISRVFAHSIYLNFSSEEIDSSITAARLCKLDLVTEMVGEFPDLQGIIGYYYAKEKHGDAVSEAIRDHYLPQGASDDVPTKPVSIIVSLADKIDTLVEMFKIGEKPTGSKDPFGLRRAALGIIRILIENNLSDVYLRYLIKSIDANLEEKILFELLDFFTERLKVMLKEQGIRHDVVSASIKISNNTSNFAVVRIKNRAEGLQDFLNNNDTMLAGYKRASNILKLEDTSIYNNSSRTVDDFEEPAEKELFLKIRDLRMKVYQLSEQEKFQETFTLLSALKTPIDNFFEKIVVNCDDEELKNNRKWLLWKVVSLMKSVANFDKIEK